MKSLITCPIAAALMLTGCSTTQPAATNESETVMVTYHVQAGKEAEFEKLLMHAWEVYRSEHMVFNQPHTVARQSENGGKTSFVEIFTWIKAPDNSPDTVRAVWKQEQSLCESRNGKNGIDFSQVQLVKTK